MASNNSRSLGPTPLEVATLAASFLPAIDLSSIAPDKEGWHPSLIKKVVSEWTTGKGRNFAPDYQPPEGWQTPFEVIAEEAVKRARVVLDAAAGKTRQAILDWRRNSGDVEDALLARQEAEDRMRAENFDRLASGRTTIPLDEVLKFALSGVYRHRRQNAWTWLRKYLASSVHALREKFERPALPVLFVDTATAEEQARAVDSMSSEGPPACIVLPHGPEYKVSRFEFPGLVSGLRSLYANRSEAERKQQARAGKKGGKKVQAKARKSKITRPESKKLDDAAKNVKNSQYGA